MIKLQDKSTCAQVIKIKTVSNEKFNRNVLKTNSELKPLKWDYDWDDTPMSDDEYFSRTEKKYWTPAKRKGEALNMVIGMTMANTLSGTFLAQLGPAAWGMVAGGFAMMCARIANIYEVNLSDTVKDTILNTAKGMFVTGLATSFTGFIPIIGNIINGAATAMLTKSIGTTMVNQFDIALRRAESQLELEKILDENKRLRRRNELLNEELKKLADEENKKNKRR